SPPRTSLRLLSVAVCEFDGIANANNAAMNHPAVQSKSSIEVILNLLKYLGRLALCIRIPCGHDATRAQSKDADDSTAHAHEAAAPSAFSKSFDAADENVGTKPTMVVTKRLDGAVGGDEKRQDVESL